MFRFEQLDAFYLLLVVPFIVILYVIYVSFRKKNISKFTELEFFPSLSPLYSSLRGRLKLFVLICALVSLIVALARPQVVGKPLTEKGSGVEIIFVVDVSNSMLATDLLPTRLEKTKFELSNFAGNLKDDRVGLVAFAGTSSLILPLTSDFMSARLFIKGLSTDMLSSQGTSITDALKLASLSFSPDNKKGKAIVLISDGEAHEPSAVETAANLYETEQIKVFTIGVGTPEGKAIQLANGNFIKDGGEIVVSKLNENLLKDVALQTDAVYIRATNSNFGLSDIKKAISKMQHTEFEAVSYSFIEEYFDFFAWIALALLSFYMLISDRKNQFFTKINKFF